MKLDEPNVGELIDQLQGSEAAAGIYYERKLENYRTRYCIWPGQSPDGLKHKERLGREPFPWDGCSDTRVRLADSTINRNVSLLTLATMDARLQCQPVESSDAASKQVAETVLKWLIYTRCIASFRREVEIAANIHEETGLVVFGVFWERTTRTEMAALSIDALAQLYQEQGDPAVGVLLSAILDPEQEEAAAEMLEEFLPGHGKLSTVRALRESGIYEYESPYIFENLPKIVALEPWEDVFFPLTAGDLQSQPYVAWRELISEADLRSRVLTDGYSEAWVEKAIGQKGKRLRNYFEWSNRGMGWVDLFSEADDERIEIFHSYRKESTKDGATRIVCTVIHPAIRDSYGKHELIPFDHGEYPFVEIPRERTTRRLIDSRGVPEIIQSNQADVKRQRDYRNDRAALAINPPLRVPTNRGKLAILMGPRAEIPERRQGEITWMEPPPYDNGSLESELSARRDAAEYFGRNFDGVDPIEAGLRQKQLVSGWLTGMKLVFTQVFQLAQQFLTDDEVLRVAGTLPAPFNTDRATIQGKFDIAVEFDPLDLDNDRLAAKLDYIAKVVLPMDIAGVIDRAGLVKFVMSAIDPKMAEMFVRPAEAATAMEAEEEQAALAQVWAGVEPPLAQPGQNAQLRLSIIQQQLSANPQWQQRYAADELFKAMLDARAQSFAFQLQQIQNAQIGRTGAAPVLGNQQNPQALAA